jgi:hypothetical protein
MMILLYQTNTEDRKRIDCFGLIHERRLKTLEQKLKETY